MTLAHGKFTFSTLSFARQLSMVIAGIRNFSTSDVSLKRTPHTVGVMSWVRAGRRRKYLEQKMRESTKQDYQILKEEKLLRMDPQLEFRTTSRTHAQLDENVMFRNIALPEVFLSKDRETIVCYHPPQPNNHPMEFTKASAGNRTVGIPEHAAKEFRTKITLDELNEALALRAKDPYLWNDTALSLLFQVQQDAIIEKVPLTREQLEIVKAEREVFKGMSLNKRKRFTDLQQWERLKYVRSSRGAKFAEWYSTVLKKPKVKTPVPPKA